MTRKNFCSVLPLLLCLVLPSAEADRVVTRSGNVTRVNPEGFFLRDSIIHRNRRAAFSDREIKETVNVHNMLRRQESSSNMEVMKWNSHLASLAQEWADVCVLDHDQRARETLPYKPIGQNIFIGSGAHVNMHNAVTYWFDEKAFYDYNSSTCQPSKVCDKYTQVVWARSREIGCGYKQCSGFGTLIVCNYKPAGNFVGQKPYVKGKACSACESGSKRCDKGLCSRVGPGRETKIKGAEAGRKPSDITIDFITHKRPQPAGQKLENGTGNGCLNWSCLATLCLYWIAVVW